VICAAYSMLYRSPYCIGDCTTPTFIFPHSSNMTNNPALCVIVWFRGSLLGAYWEPLAYANLLSVIPPESSPCYRFYKPPSWHVIHTICLPSPVRVNILSHLQATAEYQTYSCVTTNTSQEKACDSANIYNKSQVRTN
jgi:hypothetical protein